MKAILYLVVFIISVFGASCGIYYVHVSDEEHKKTAIERQKLQERVIELAKESVQKSDLGIFHGALEAIGPLETIEYAKIKMKKLSFTDGVLLDKVFLKDAGWHISDVTVDIIDGEIKNTDDGVYELSLFDKKGSHTVNIKFQAIKDDIVKDFFIPFDTEKTVSLIPQNGNETYEKIEEKDFSLWLRDGLIANEELIKKRFYVFAAAFAFFITVFFFAGVLLYRYRQKSFTASLNAISGYMQSVLQGKILKEPMPPSDDKSLYSLYINGLELGKKYIGITNELTVSRDIIFQKERTDELTGLPNKKSFENDLKYMFISNKDGYIIYLKMDKIGLFTKNHGPEIVDSMIEDFAKSIQNHINTQKGRKGAIYRFFGGEFAMILYENTVEEVESFLQEIIALNKALSDKYYFFDGAVYYGASPFDHYGTVESIMQSAQDAYEAAFKEKSKSYFIVDMMHQIEFNKKLEGSVKDIIQRNDFVLQYIHDIYTFGEEPQLLMQEVSPLIIDSFTYENIPTGKFISVAEKMGVVAEFDKALILKALEHVEFGELTHRICIVLSVSSINDKLFISWLEGISEENAFMRNIVFTSPGYSVAGNFDDFKRFFAVLKSHNVEAMIKRYDPADLELENLKELTPSYLKLDKSLCQDFKKDSTKQHAVKQILLFAEENDIKVIGDSLKNEQDIMAFEMLGVYGSGH